MLNWKHIKGFNGTSGVSGFATYTYFEFQKNSNTSTPNESFLPHIFIRNDNVSDPGSNGSTYDYGHIVTNNVVTNFFKDVFIGDQTNANLYVLNHLYMTDDGLGGLGYFQRPGTNNWDLRLYDDSGRLTLDGAEGVWVKSGFLVGRAEDTKNSIFYGNLQVSIGDVTIDNVCNAGYFNALSDLRAKENLIPVDIHSMLDLINYMPVYTFNYKNKPEQRNLGIIAQDVQNIDIDGFSLVDNKNASGKDGDFMSIHESKLVYILLGAVQELSKQVEELKKKIGE